MLNEQVLSNLKNAITEVLHEHDKRYVNSEIYSLINRWYTSKKNLIEKMRTHPNWNEDAFAIILTTNEVRDINSREIYNTVRDMLNYAYYNNAIIDNEIKNSINSLWEYHYQFVDTDMKEKLQHCDLKITEGQKVSRILNTLFIKAGLNKLPDYNKLYAKIADAYNPLTIKRTSILSVHPCDYLHMSNGTGWQSCHNINDGCYMAGTLSYMCDEVSLIFYTIDNGYEGNNFYNQKKITRNVFCYYDTMLMQSRLYPNNDENKKTQYREMVQNIFSICDNIPNLWIKKNFESIGDYCGTHKDAKHYTDYECADYCANISLQKEYKIKERMIIGSTCHCLKCEDVINDEHYLYCDYCSDDRMICDGCGHRIDGDEICIDGYNYCHFCVSYCKKCGEYTREEVIYINGYYVCDDCLNRHYIQCKDCGKYMDKDGIEHSYINSSDKYVCKSCFGKDYFSCAECGKNHSINKYNNYDNVSMCNDCYNDIIKDKEYEVV